MPIACISPNERSSAAVTAELLSWRAQPQRDETARVAIDYFLWVTMDARLCLVLVDASDVALKIMLSTERTTTFRLAARIWASEWLRPIRVRVVRREVCVEIVGACKGLVALGTGESLHWA